METRRTVALCEACGTPYAGFYDAEGRLRILGATTCPKCGEVDLREITAEEVE